MEKKNKKGVDVLPSGTYRVRKMVNGKPYCVTFDHYPTDNEIMLVFAEKITDQTVISEHITFKAAAIQYVATKSNLLSPTTLRDYKTYPSKLSKNFVNMYIEKITQVEVQIEINKLAKKYAPKTVRNYHGFISAVLRVFKPSLILSTTLPQKRKFEPYTPSEDDIRKILDAVKGTKYSIPFQLGVMGLRRSEICALKLSDIHGDYLHIERAYVEGENGFVIKEYPKTTDSNRKIYLSKSLQDEIRENKCIFDGYPSMLNKRLKLLQKEFEMPSFRFHDLRAFYVSYAHACGVPDKIIMSSGGWSTTYVMNRHYKRELQSEVDYFQKAIAEDLFK